MKQSLVLVACTLLLSTVSFGSDAFPTSPDLALTPGTLCTKPTSHRYPEHIAYCERDVESWRKREIIATYDSEDHYRIGSMNRSDFKIDHYIPLCMGGSNETSNLWPQHKSVFIVTDPLEQVACQKMAAGRLHQRDAVSIMRRAKADLVEARRLLEQVRRL